MYRMVDTIFFLPLCANYRVSLGFDRRPCPPCSRVSLNVVQYSNFKSPDQDGTTYSASAEIVYSQARDTTLENHSNSMVHQKGPGSTHGHTDSSISRLQRPPRHPLSRPLTPGSAQLTGTNQALITRHCILMIYRPAYGRAGRIPFFRHPGEPNRHTKFRKAGNSGRES